ncbi:hypothetical protein MPSEU_000043500 [Mayamaea pseudoterrestris]|nr:hypothetical protein MPSEU_000043500 [Mayamaea pseudoterrestris]
MKKDKIPFLLGGGSEHLQPPWFHPDSKLLTPAQRKSIANLQKYIYGGDVPQNNKTLDEDESQISYPKGCNAGAHFREVLSSSYRTNFQSQQLHQVPALTPSKRKPKASIVQCFSACTSTKLDEVMDFFGRGYKETFDPRCGGQDDYYDDEVTLRGTMETFEDDEDVRLRRLGSWSTQGTFGTLPTDGTMEFSAIMDDDGHLIHPKILQAAQDKKRNLPIASKKMRLVKFDYPPVSSMRQCPRADRDDLAELFFTEEELENYEADRECTRRTDDIEIVAISQSLSDLNDAQRHGADDEVRVSEPSPCNSHITASVSPRSGGFGAYVPTPRNICQRRNSRVNSESYSTVVNTDICPDKNNGGNCTRRNSWSKVGRPTPESPSLEPLKQELAAPHASPRLVKSVQIFLRERSTAK